MNNLDSSFQGQAAGDLGLSLNATLIELGVVLNSHKTNVEK